MSKPMKKIAVYQIRNVISSKFYIGSSANLYERWRTHRNKLRAKTHPNPHLQASWDKHGEDVFKFEILAEFESVDDMLTCENGLIDTHINNPLCMNIAKWADTPMRGRTGELHPMYGKARSIETKQLLRQARLRQADPRFGKLHSDETKAKIGAKVQKALAEGRGGKFIPSEETRQKMSEALKGNQCAAGYKRTDTEKEAIRQRMLGNQNWLGKTHSVESRERMGRPVIAVSPEGVEKTYSTISFLRAETGLLPPTINRALKSGEPLAKGPYKGWSFKYCPAPQTAVK